MNVFLESVNNWSCTNISFSFSFRRQSLLYKRNADLCFVDAFTSVLQEWKEIVTHYTTGRKEEGSEEGRSIDFWPWLLSSHLILSVIVFFNKHIKQWTPEDNITEKQNLTSLSAPSSTCVEKGLEIISVFTVFQCTGEWLLKLLIDRN